MTDQQNDQGASAPEKGMPSDYHISAANALVESTVASIIIEFQDDGEVQVIPKALLTDISWTPRGREYKVIADRGELIDTDVIYEAMTAENIEAFACFIEDEYEFFDRVLKPQYLDRYELRDDGGSTTIVDASPDEVEDAAKDWVHEGDWGDGGCIVRVHYDRMFSCPYDACGEEFAWSDAARRKECPHCNEEILVPDDDEIHEDTVSVEIPQDPYAIDEHLKDLEDAGHEHNWSAPHAIVGGLKENPGVRGGSGVQVFTHDVCACGAHKHTDCDRQRYQQGQGLETIETIEYPDGLWPWGEDCEEPGVWGHGGVRITSLEDQDLLKSSSALLLLGAEYDSGFVDVQNYNRVCGMVRADHDTIGATVFTTGGGILDDGVFSGHYTLNWNSLYRVEIDAIGPADTFRWSDDGGATWEAAGVAITGAAQTLSNGVVITFGLVTGHAIGDRWDITAIRLTGVLTIIQSQDGILEDAYALVTNIYDNDPANASYEVDNALPYAKLQFVAGARDLTMFRASMNGKVG